MSLKSVVNWLTYLAVRSALCLLQALPLKTAYAIARALGQFGCAVDRRHRLLAMDNLRRAMPGKYTEQELLQIVENVYVHFATLSVEIAHTPRILRATSWRNYVRPWNQRGVVEKVLTGRPVILLTAHFGNWEMAGYLMAVFGFKPHSIARTLDNPYLERLLRTFRTRTGQEIIYKRGAFDQVSEVMERGSMVAFLSDQDAGSRGLFVDFFGRPASSHRGVALLSLEHDAPICVGFARRLGRGYRFDVWVELVIEPRDYRHLPNPVWSITQDFTRAYERVVRQNPEQYLWLHRRWKHQPSDNRESRAA